MTQDVIRRYGLTIFLSTLAFSLIFADGGLFGYVKTKLDTRKVNAEIVKLEKENYLLTRELDRLQKDDKYLEDVVRTKYGLLRDGERLYRVEK